MPETTTKTADRAAYMRAYRARKAAEAPAAEPTPCKHCGEPLKARRGALFCSSSCRWKHWSRITHRSAVRDPAGWIIPANRSGAGGLEKCSHTDQLPDGNATFCREPATWWVMSHRNEESGMFWYRYWCEEHAPQHPDTLGPCDPEAACHRGAVCPAKRRQGVFS